MQEGLGAVFILGEPSGDGLLEPFPVREKLVLVEFVLGQQAPDLLGGVGPRRA